MQGKGKLSKEAVASRMGKPSGIARVLHRHVRGALRAWFTVPAPAIVGGELHVALVVASFDASGKLVDVRVDEKQRPQ